MLLDLSTVIKKAKHVRTAPFDKTTEHDLGLDIGFKKYQTGIGGQKNIDSIVDDIIEYLEEEEII